MISAVKPKVTQAQSHSKGWLFYFLGVICLTALAACSREPQILQLAGHSMGTSWHVTVIADQDIPPVADLQQGIEALLEEVNVSMSTYREDSEITRFNSAEAETWFPVSADFYQVLTTALAVGFQSDGAYDVTVGPLVDLWGFGPAGAVTAPPSAQSISDILEQVGQDKLRVDGEGLRVKKVAALSLDFSSIAKGFAVDRIARWLGEQGVGRYLVEVGGEMRLSGLSGRGDPWRIAIEQPDRLDRGVARAISLTESAVATSGDYRNYFEVEGVRYSHSIDPRTGYPVSHELVSVTVIHPSAMLADAWATALTVLGLQEGMTVAQAHGLAVYFIQREGQVFSSSHTRPFEQYLETAGPGQ